MTKRLVEGRTVQTAYLFTVDLAKVKGKGDFHCPKCGLKISPNDKTEKAYAILETLMKDGELDSVMLQCKRCESHIQLTGFRVAGMMK